mmetsp:Transcript_51556/g.137608  ORF Transcript_51556/g.137608 Transcript_51556/m.137608 type:complete len:463 (-) Transcript_51556:106-1494(-)
MPFDRSRAASLAFLFSSLRLSGANDQTYLTDVLNRMIKIGSKGIYTGGKGVVIRSPDFLSSSTYSVLPATFWVNDIIAPSQMYPGNGNPWCPNSGWDGWMDVSWVDCSGAGGSDGPWDFALVGTVIGTATHNLFYKFDSLQKNTWGWGVFYPADANSVDQRCRFQPGNNGWDCPGYWVDMSGNVNEDSTKGGAGYYPAGNPYANDAWGGGSGCHFDKSSSSIDQTDASASNGQSILGDYSCECNYVFNDDWTHWVETWVSSNTQKDGFEWRDWFGGGLAPAWGLDVSICWVNNVRDMINLQNALYFERYTWNNQMVPTANWGGGTAEDRKYWGWNEVPMDAQVLNDPGNWDAVMIKLPADTCQEGTYGTTDRPSCLTTEAQNQLEKDLQSFIDNGALLLGGNNAGSRPGSTVVFAREYMYPYDSGLWYRKFFCAQWATPSGDYTIHFEATNSNTTGACYISN